MTAKHSAAHTPAPQENLAPQENTASVAAPKKDRPALKLFAVVLGVPVVLIVMLLAFLGPSLNSGAKDLPLAISGPTQVTQQIATKLDQQSPGTFDITTYNSVDDAKNAVHQREAIGVISVNGKSVEIVTASGAGTPYAPLLKKIGAGLEASGTKVIYTDVAPLPEKDPTGTAISTLGLPLAFGGNVSAILLLTLLKAHPRLRLLGGLLLSVTGGFLTTAVLQFGFKVVQGDYWLTSLALSLGIAAICLTLQGLHNLAGMAGLGTAGILLLFVSNPLAGLATGPWWLPAPWGTVGQMLPIGAAGTAIRSAVYFDGAGSGSSFLVLGIWALIGFLLSAFISRHKSRKATAA